MFKKLTKFIVNQTNPREEFVPVESIADNEHFSPLYLLKRKGKSKTIFHPAPYYQQTGFTLHDVLLPAEYGESTEPFLQDSSQFTLTKISKDQADGGLSIPCDPASADLQGGASFSKEIVIKTHNKSVPLESLEKLRRERKINMDHSFIQQLQRTHISLYVVTEILEASEETVYKESTKADGGFKAKFYATLSGKGTREVKQTIVIPKGCTLAFRTIPLHIEDGAWHLELLMNSENSSDEKLEEVMSEVKDYCGNFPELSPELLLISFNTIKAVMRDKNLLQELRQKMDEFLELNDAYELKTESPDLKDLFSILQHSPEWRLLELAGGITYILDALHELMDEQLLLLLESLERKILSQQLELVRSHITLGSFQGDTDYINSSNIFIEEQMLTMELVEMSGVQLQEDGTVVSLDQPFEAMAALFVALYALKLLSGSK
uniref:Gasdermin-A n=1 Tax=Catharus ustulatus TaxID=91951 RepID=A0A8C3USF7_CATUS